MRGDKGAGIRLTAGGDVWRGAAHHSNSAEKAKLVRARCVSWGLRNKSRSKKTKGDLVNGKCAAYYLKRLTIASHSHTQTPIVTGGHFVWVMPGMVQGTNQWVGAIEGYASCSGTHWHTLGGDRMGGPPTTRHTLLPPELMVMPLHFLSGISRGEARGPAVHWCE